MLKYLLLGWALFLVVFYAGVWLDYVWYRHNYSRKLNAIIEAFTEEDDEE